MVGGKMSQSPGLLRMGADWVPVLGLCAGRGLAWGVDWVSVCSLTPGPSPATGLGVLGGAGLAGEGRN